MTGVRYPDGQPLFFTLHGGGGVKKLDKPIEGHLFPPLTGASECINIKRIETIMKSEITNICGKIN